MDTNPAPNPNTSHENFQVGKLTLSAWLLRFLLAVKLLTDGAFAICSLYNRFSRWGFEELVLQTFPKWFLGAFWREHFTEVKPSCIFMFLVEYGIKLNLIIVQDWCMLLKQCLCVCGRGNFINIYFVFYSALKETTNRKNANHFEISLTAKICHILNEIFMTASLKLSNVYFTD